MFRDLVRNTIICSGYQPGQRKRGEHMSRLRVWRNARVLRLALVVSFGLALFVALLLGMGLLHSPGVTLSL